MKKITTIIILIILLVIACIFIFRTDSQQTIESNPLCFSTNTTDMYSCLTSEITRVNAKIAELCAGDKTTSSGCRAVKSDSEIEKICTEKLGDPADQGSEYGLELVYCQLTEKEATLKSIEGNL